MLRLQLVDQRSRWGVRTHCCQVGGGAHHPVQVRLGGQSQGQPAQVPASTCNREAGTMSLYDRVVSFVTEGCEKLTTVIPTALYRPPQVLYQRPILAAVGKLCSCCLRITWMKPNIHPFIHSFIHLSHLWTNHPSSVPRICSSMEPVR